MRARFIILMLLTALGIFQSRAPAQASGGPGGLAETRSTAGGATYEVNCSGTYDRTGRLTKLTDVDHEGNLLYSVVLYLGPKGRVVRADKVGPGGAISGVLVYFEDNIPKAFDKEGNPANVGDWEFDLKDMDRLAKGSVAAGTGVIATDPGAEVFDLSKLEQPPVPTYQVRPDYPLELRRAGISGAVTVEFIVGITGDVREAFAVKSTQRDFEGAAVAAVLQWKFKPGMRQGVPVNTRLLVPIVFSLNKK
jgi:TonB family protein